MPPYIVSNGVRKTISDDLYDLLWNGLENIETTDTETSTEEIEVPRPFERPKNAEWRKQSDVYFNVKPIDKDYFKKYYQNKTKEPCVCNICGKEISCKSNLSKHQKTKTCKSYI